MRLCDAHTHTERERDFDKSKQLLSEKLTCLREGTFQHLMS